MLGGLQQLLQAVVPGEGEGGETRGQAWALQCTGQAGENTGHRGGGGGLGSGQGWGLEGTSHTWGPSGPGKGGLGDSRRRGSRLLEVHAAWERSSEVRRGRTAIRVAQKRGRGQCPESCMGRGPPRGQAQQETRSWRGKGRGVTRTSEPGLPVAEGDSLAPSHLGLGPASGRSAPPGSCRQRQKEAARMRPWAPDRLRGPEPRFAARARARASEEGRPRPSGALGSGRGGACACRWLGSGDQATPRGRT